MILPIRDENPIRITPYVTYVLIALNVVVFLYEGTLNQPELLGFLRLFAVVPEELTTALQGGNVGQPVPELLTPFTSQFLHAGWLHLGGNMLFLWIFGNNIEEELGRSRYLLLYLSCGALAAMTQWYFTAQSGTPSLGASGAIAGVMGAYILRFPGVAVETVIPPLIFFTFRVPAVFYLGFWFLQQAFYGVGSLSPANVGMEGGGVAYWAHAGGFVFGAILAPALGLFPDERDPYG